MRRVLVMASALGMPVGCSDAIAPFDGEFDFLFRLPTSGSRPPW